MAKVHKITRDAIGNGENCFSLRQNNGKHCRSNVGHAVDELKEGQSVLPPSETAIGQFIDPQSPSSQALTTFMEGNLASYDPNSPQAYLVYLFFDKSMLLDPSKSGMLKVAQSDVLEEHYTQELSMTKDGYFYTYFTNRSTRKVRFDNLTITHLQGQIRAKYDYYSYGLAW